MTELLDSLWNLATNATTVITIAILAIGLALALRMIFDAIFRGR